MTASPTPTPPRMPARMLRVWTPQRVPLTLAAAGLGERALAYAIDVGIVVGAALAGLFIYNIQGDLQADVGALSTVGTIGIGIVVATVVVLYDTLFEVLSRGRTPGKRIMQLQVVTLDGSTPNLLTALVRNMLRLVDFLPVAYAVGTVALFFSGTRRLGDLIANTVVISRRVPLRSALEHCTQLAAGAAPLTQQLAWSDHDCAAALAMVERSAELSATNGDALCARLLSRLAVNVDTNTSARARLAQCCVQQSRRPRTVLHALAGVDLAAQELAAALSTPDINVDAAVARAEAAIFAGGGALLRAVRCGVDARHVRALSQALFDQSAQPPMSGSPVAAIRTLLFHELPQAIYQERALVLRAAGVLALGALLGGVLAWCDPQVARAIISNDIAQRVEAGADWTNRTEADGSFALSALTVIVNNVGVGLRVFVFGLLGGVMTLLGLAYNGLQLGAVFGYAIELHTAGTLLRFIAAHGPVELTMVCVAGAAGLCLGRAVVSPGARSRLQALRVEGARGVRLVLAATLGFIGIGTVEGFISPGQRFGTVLKVCIGLTLWLLFFAWVRAASTLPKTQAAD